MRAIFFWRTTSEVDLEHLAERDGIRWVRGRADRPREGVFPRQESGRLVIGEPLHEGCGEAAMVDLDVDALPLPSELEPGGDADPDRPHAWRDHDADDRPGADDVPGGDPDDGPIDSDESFAAWEKLGIVPRWLPPLDAF